MFTSISLMRPHILLLDEPTNHLDMQSIDALCDALDEFTGGVVVISHDAQLLSRLCADEEHAEVSRAMVGVLMCVVRFARQRLFGVWCVPGIGFNYHRLTVGVSVLS